MMGTVSVNGIFVMTTLIALMDLTKKTVQMILIVMDSHVIQANA